MYPNNNGCCKSCGRKSCQCSHNHKTTNAIRPLDRPSWRRNMMLSLEAAQQTTNESIRQLQRVRPWQNTTPLRLEHPRNGIVCPLVRPRDRRIRRVSSVNLPSLSLLLPSLPVQVSSRLPRPRQVKPPRQLAFTSDYVPSPVFHPGTIAPTPSESNEEEKMDMREFRVNITRPPPSVSNVDIVSTAMGNFIQMYFHQVFEPQHPLIPSLLECKEPLTLLEKQGTKGNASRVMKVILAYPVFNEIQTPTQVHK